MDISKNLNILIVGAGPVGLTLAIELARRGYTPRIIEKNSTLTPPHESRALAINLRTMDLMAPSGVAQQFEDAGLSITKASFHWQKAKIADIHITDHPRHDAKLIALPQGASERILHDTLTKFGIKPEWNTKLVKVENLHTRPTATLQYANGETETILFDYVFGCDGARSKVRKSAKIKFTGETSQTRWSLIDVQYKRDLVPQEFNAFIAPKIANAHIPISKNTLRIIGNTDELEPHIPFPDEIDRITWQSSFSVSYRQVETFTKGKLFLCGDAAHIHSPAGGRGMNLGIEDACWLAWCLDTDQLESYNPARMKAAKKVLALTKAQTRVITGKIPGASLLIKYIAPIMLKFKFTRNNMLTQLLGLDTAPPAWL